MFARSLVALVIVVFAMAGQAGASIERPAAIDAAAGQYAVVAPIFIGAGDVTSYLRLVNNGGSDSGTQFSATTYSITVVGSPSGSTLGAASIQVAAHASPQYAISEILTLAGVTGLTGGDTGYTLYIQNPDRGTGFMHVIYNGASGFFENASICQGYVQADSANKNLFNVHTSVLAGYPSQIYMHNYAGTAVTYRVTVYDARTGATIGSTNVPIGANATASMAFTSFEQLLNWTPTANQQHANMTFEAVGPIVAPVIVGSFITNQRLGTSINMSAICKSNVLDEAQAGTNTPTFMLTASRTGTGLGTVVSAPAGLSCGFTCIFPFATGSAVTLTATPQSGSTFQGWGGACSGTGACSVTMDATKAVNAAFALTTNTLTVTKTGGGSGAVSSSQQPGINCGNTCSAAFTTGATVALTATPATGARFTGWSGACSGTGICSVVMSTAQSVTATFAPDFTLTVARSGNGNVVSVPAGINCGTSTTSCVAGFATGEPVTLTAAAGSGSRFAGWSGACTGTGVCIVTMNAGQSVTATFDSNFTVTVSVTGSGQVNSSPAGIVCGILGSTCSAGFATGTTVSLSAGAAGTFQRFTGWSGPCASIVTNSGDSICNVVVTANQSITAMFNAN